MVENWVGNLRIGGSRPTCAQMFFQNTAGKFRWPGKFSRKIRPRWQIFFCYMYEYSLRHQVWVPEINVRACNSVGCLFSLIPRRNNYKSVNCCANILQCSSNYKITKEKNPRHLLISNKLLLKKMRSGIDCTKNSIESACYPLHKLPKYKVDIYIGEYKILPFSLHKNLT